MSRFFVEKSQIGEFVSLFGENVEHIAKVLRLTVGDEITLCDGERTDYRAEITEITKRNVTCRVIESCPNNAEPDVEISLFVSLLKRDKLEFVIQKATELGIYDIYPVLTEFTAFKYENDRAGKKLERWQKIAESAAKQSERGIVPKIHDVISFEKALELFKAYELPLFFYERECDEKISFMEGSKAKKVAFFIGPEGGFSPGEIKMVKSDKLKTVSLGRRILRAETAPIVALSLILYNLEEF